MGANSSTRRVSFESDENDNITVVKGIRLSENVINRMREPQAPVMTPTPPRTPSPPLVADPTPFLLPISPPFDPITSLPPFPAPIEPIAPPPLSAPEPVAPPSPSMMEQPPVEPVAPPPPAPEPVAVVAPPPPPPAPVEPVAPAPPAPEPEAVAAPPPPPPSVAPSGDEEELRRRITQELQQGLEEERGRAEQELQAWLQQEQSQAQALAQAEAQAQVPDEVSRLLAVERAGAQQSLQQAVLRERLSTEDERVRAQLYEIGRKARQLETRDAELKKQEAFYREQVAKLEERSAQFYKVTTENYHKAADQVNTKFKRYETSPVCVDLQGQILKCYRENTGRTLHCSNIAALYLQCVNNAKQSGDYVHAPSWATDITS
ncbi:LOW QUALITY PROTEIN: coiled-coil-helix-coiled-coil-helix domain containing 3a [Osmerus eperlanus]|uniref:LOW QUALITY PROTEIN: coiled-coil-helix-coiled-coil-helix domain containing 3a n=1 Tax=Osmerus eperlanus TaxID=29151 RepID=UPI002E0FABC2